MSKKIMIYGLGTFFSKILVFLMVPIYTRVFSVSDYGYYDVLIQNLQMIVSISFLEIWSGILRYMFDGENKLRPINTFKKMLPFLLCIYAFSFFILGRITEVKYIPLSIIYGILYLIFTISNSECRGYGNNVLYVLSGFLSTFISCSLSIVFAVIMHRGIEYLIISQCVGYIVASILVEFRLHCFKDSFHTKDSVPLNEMIKYCFPLMLNSFSFLFLGTYNKNVILKVLGKEASGYYAYISKFSTILSILISIYALAWQEEAFLSANSSNQDQKYSRYINLFIKMVGLGTPIFTILLFWGAPIVGGSQYTVASVYIPFAILSAFIAGLSSVYSTLLTVDKKTNYIFVSTVIGALANVALATVLIPKVGIDGANISLCTGFGATVLMRGIFAAKRHDIRLDKLLFVLVFAGMGLCYWVFHISNATAAVFLLIGLVLVWMSQNYNEAIVMIVKIKNRLGK